LIFKIFYNKLVRLEKTNVVVKSKIDQIILLKKKKEKENIRSSLNIKYWNTRKFLALDAQDFSSKASKLWKKHKVLVEGIITW
jgi:hypothetical protein